MKHISYGYTLPEFVLETRGHDIHNDSHNLAAGGAGGPQSAREIYGSIEKGLKAVQASLCAGIFTRPFFIRNLLNSNNQHGVLYMAHVTTVNSKARKAICTYLQNSEPRHIDYVGVDAKDLDLAREVFAEYNLEIARTADRLLPALFGVRHSI